MSLLFKDYSVVKAIYLLFRFIKPKSFLWNSKSADRNRADRYARKTHQPHTEKKMTFERVSVKKVIPHVPFLEQPPYFSSPSLFVEKMWIPLLPFLEIFLGKFTPLPFFHPPFIKDGFQLGRPTYFYMFEVTHKWIWKIVYWLDYQ